MGRYPCGPPPHWMDVSLLQGSSAALNPAGYSGRDPVGLREPGAEFPILPPPGNCGLGRATGGDPVPGDCASCCDSINRGASGVPPAVAGRRAAIGSNGSSNAGFISSTPSSAG